MWHKEEVTSRMTNSNSKDAAEEGEGGQKVQTSNVYMTLLGIYLNQSNTLNQKIHFKVKSLFDVLDLKMREALILNHSMTNNNMSS